MKYSSYFSSITSENGQPNLNAEQFKRMMNITFIEGVLQGVSKIKEQYIDSQYYYKFDTIIFKHDLVLTKLTGNLEPKELLREMYKLSERN